MFNRRISLAVFLSLTCGAAFAGPLDDIRSKAQEIIQLSDSMSAPTPSGCLPPASPQDGLSGTVPIATGLNPGESAETQWVQQRAVYQRKMKNTPEGSVLFFGDSHIEAMSLSGFCNAEGFGISGESFRQLLYRLNEGGSANIIHRAGAVVILTGVNDLADPYNGGHANRAATVNIMIDRLAQWVTGKIIIIKIPPVDSAVLPETVATNPASSAVASVNAYYVTKFGSNPNARIVDANPVLAPNGSLLPQYHIGDGQHLSAAGYAVLKPLIRQALTSLGM